MPILAYHAFVGEDKPRNLAAKVALWTLLAFIVFAIVGVVALYQLGYIDVITKLSAGSQDGDVAGSS